jgi:hypothetical protein
VGFGEGTRLYALEDLMNSGKEVFVLGEGCCYPAWHEEVMMRGVEFLKECRHVFMQGS